MANLRELRESNNGKLPAFIWPGGYPMYYLDADNQVLCADCANRSADDPDELPSFKPADGDANYEDAHLYCDSCNERIPSAYAEED
jgi:hypothetical protein